QLLSPTILAFPDDAREADDPADPDRLAFAESDHRVVRDDCGPEPHLGVYDVEERTLAAPGEGVPHLLGELVPRRPLRIEFPNLIQRPVDHPHVPVDAEFQEAPRPAGAEGIGLDWPVRSEPSEGVAGAFTQPRSIRRIASRLHDILLGLRAPYIRR